MSHRIFKYPLEVQQRQLVQLPESAQPLWVTEQNSQLVLYAQVRWPDPGRPQSRVFQVVTTGDEFEGEHKRFIGACTLGGWFQAFVFEIVGAYQPDPVDRRNDEDFRQIKRELAEA